MSSRIILPARTIARMADRRKPNLLDKYDIRQEVKEAVAKPSTLSNIEKLRQAREMLRSMPPEQAFELIEFRENLNFFETLELTKKPNCLIVPNDVIDGILIRTKFEISSITGSLIVYEKLGVPFGNSVVYGNVSVKIPIDYVGKINYALVIDHPDFELVGNEIKILEDGKVYIIKNFFLDQWWLVRQEPIKVPNREQVGASQDMRGFYRSEFCHIGFLTRSSVDKPSINVKVWPSAGLRVALLPIGKLGDSHV